MCGGRCRTRREETNVRVSLWLMALGSVVAARGRDVRWRSTRGEGVVSLAIGVVIMAFLGVMLWIAFKATLGTATNNVNQQVAKLGQ